VIETNAADAPGFETSTKAITESPAARRLNIVLDNVTLVC